MTNRPNQVRFNGRGRASFRGSLAAGTRLATLGTVLALVGAGTASAAAPAVTAPSAAVIETSTGTVLFAKNGTRELGMASTTKLMTALVALDTKSLSTVLTAVDYHPGAAETRLGLQAGEKMKLADLVRAMMLPSANDAAETVGVRTGGTQAKFVAMMNAKAKDLGLEHTHFSNPIGLDSPSHYTSALDLARIGVAAHANPFLRATVKRPRITLGSGAVTRTVINRNDLVGDPVPGGRIDGMKTGHTTAAGYSLVGSATVDGVSVVSVVLGEPSEAARDVDTARLLRWGSQLFVQRTIVHAQQRVAVVPVNGGKVDQVSAVAPKALVRVIPRGAKITLEPVSMSPGLEAPVAAGTKVGVARVLVNGKLVDRVPLVTRVAVEKQSALAALAEGASDHWKGLLLALALLLGGTLTILKARQNSRPSPRPRRGAAEPTERTTAP